MYDANQDGDPERFTRVGHPDTELLTAREERELLRALGECKAKLAEALANVPAAELPEGPDDPQARARYAAEFYAGDGAAEAALGATYRRYRELRGKLAMANMRLVAHVAKRFRERGVAYSDLLQEGFCGLLEAIDRFDLGRETKLATYATWWIRQSMQRAVASGAYPVRLTPRHLRQLAQNQGEIERTAGSENPRSVATPPRPPDGVSADLIHRIYTATRPTVSLDAAFDRESSFSLSQTLSDTPGDAAGDLDRDETLTKLWQHLRPREQEVLAHRFGLQGKERLSLSQVGKLMAVSKERIRQIQDRALEKLRAAAVEARVDELSLVGP